MVLPSPDRRLTNSERARLAFEIAAAYVRVRWLLVRLDFKGSVAAARAAGAAPQPLDEASATVAGLRLGSIVDRALGVIPFDSRCLIRSLVLTRLLARRGIDSTFVLGVRNDPQFVAHAWLERFGTPLLPTGPEFHRLVEL
jgi:hypothetical protein